MARRWLRQAKDQYWRSVPPLQWLRGASPVLCSFDEAYPDASVLHHVPGQDVPAPFLDGVRFNRPAAHLVGSTYAIPADTTARVENALLASTASVVLSPERNVVSESSTAAGMQYFLKREFFLTPTRLQGRVAPLRSRFHNFYHWMVDCLPRLIALAALDPVHHPIDLVYTGKLASYETFFLNQFDEGVFRLRKIEPHTLYAPDVLMYTSLKTQRFAGYLREVYAEGIRDLVAPDASSARSSDSGRRVIISRANAEYRRLANEPALVDALASRGFETARPETMSIQEQADLFRDASIIVSPHGAGLANAIYARDASVIELFPTALTTPHYLFLCASLGHNYTAVHHQVDDLNPPAFDADVEAVCQYVDAM